MVGKEIREVEAAANAAVSNVASWMRGASLELQAIKRMLCLSQAAKYLSLLDFVDYVSLKASKKQAAMGT